MFNRYVNKESTLSRDYAQGHVEMLFGTMYNG